MTCFHTFPVPPERHPTAEARASLNVHLEFDDDNQIQDWERYFADETRIAEFLDLYFSGPLDADQRSLLMDLIIASTAFAEDGQVTVEQWSMIETALLANADLHGRTVWEWADIDEETGISPNDFPISERMQDLWVKIANAG
tara:strand:+ start:3013 stop:3438 length:426 start_codon:yes stop_codon:yes gene_type:complete